MSSITTYCSIQGDQVLVQGKPWHLEDGSEVASSIYKQLGITYPKFHKMDLLAKRALVGVALLKHQNAKIEAWDETEIALLFANSESSEHSDLLFYQSYTQTDNPSPSQFVYTLPNIMLGEVAIRNKWFGENIFLYMPQLDGAAIIQQIQLQFASGVKVVVFGWVNVSESHSKSAFCWIEKEGTSGLELTEETLIQLIG